MLVNHLFEEQVERLTGLLEHVKGLLQATGAEYRVVGGFAVYLHITSVDELAGRTTRDVDVVIRRSDLDRIAAAAPRFGFEYGHATGLDMLVDRRAPKAKYAVHLLMAGERVKATDAEPVPNLDTGRVELRGVPVIPMLDLLRMKLSAFRDKDRVHVRDMDEVGLITAEIESQLSPELLTRLQHVRSTE
jgi:hypothetical protein